MMSIFSPFSSAVMLETRAAGTDAGADRINVLVVRGNGDLGAVACLTCDGLDLDHAGMDLRYLELEQALDQTRMGAGNDDLHAARAAANLDEVNLDVLTLDERLAADLLRSRKDGLALLAAGNNVQISAAAARVDAGDRSVQDLVLLAPNSEMTMPRSASRMP